MGADTRRCSESTICLGEKDISPKVLKITPKVLMITFGVIDVGDKFCEYPRIVTTTPCKKRKLPYHIIHRLPFCVL